MDLCLACMLSIPGSTRELLMKMTQHAKKNNRIQNATLFFLSTQLQPYFEKLIICFEKHVNIYA